MELGLRQFAARILSVCFLTCSLAEGQSPVAQKIEPPNWWIGLPDPMLLITGKNLSDAHVSVDEKDVSVVRTSSSRNGDYLFVWLQVLPSAKSGSAHLNISSAGGSATVDFPLQARNPAAMQANANTGYNGFSTDDVLYLIMPDRFDDGDPGNNFPESGAYNRKEPRAYHGGDLRGIEQRLPYLNNLGVTTIWIAPVYQNDDRTGRDYHGYGATDLYAVEKHLGSLDDFRSLTRAAHERGMKVILDIVPNHIGPNHSWVEDPPSEHWIHGTREKHLAVPTTFAPAADPHAPQQETKPILEGWFADILPDMSTDDSTVATYLRENALWWAESGALDGFRLDTFPYVDRAFWRDFHDQLHATYPRFRTVGEVFNPNPSVTAFFVGGKTVDGIDTGVDTIFDFPLFQAIRAVVLENTPTTAFEEVFHHDWMFPHPENLVTFIGNHDTSRFMGEKGATTEKLKLAFSLLLTMRGIPQIYYADEIGMAGGDDPDNRHDFPGGFPGDSHIAFTSEGRSPEQKEVFGHVRKLLQLRREHPALRSGKQIDLATDEKSFAYVREFPAEDSSLASESLLMVMNNADKSRTLELDLHDTPIASARTLEPLMESGSTVNVDSDRIRISVKARSLDLYQVK
jgi:neopullulanase